MFERSKQGAVDLIRGDQPLNVDHVERVAEILKQCSGRAQPRVVLDFDHIPLLDSAGLELLLDTQEAFQQQGGAIKLAGSNPLCNEILMVTGVGRHFEIYADVPAAVGSFVQ